MAAILMSRGTKFIREVYVLFSCNHTEQGVGNIALLSQAMGEQAFNMLEIIFLDTSSPSLSTQAIFLCRLNNKPSSLSASSW